MRWALWGIKGKCPKCGSSNVGIERLWFKLLNHCGWCDHSQYVNHR